MVRARSGSLRCGRGRPCHRRRLGGDHTIHLGRWDAAARAYHASMEERRNEEVAASYGAEGAFHPAATRAALATFAAPVLLLAGERDVAAPPRIMAEVASLFPDATLATQPGAGHFPWLDDPTWFASTVAEFLC
jgi:proline iminopeptidase